MHRYLTQEKADTVFACFGMNEAFRGVEGLAEFSSGLEALILDLQKHRYNGRSAPQIILISPIAHENLGGHMPDGQVHNVNLEIYTQAMLEIAGKYKLAFVDLYTPTRELMVFSKGPDFTINGIHLNNYGYWRVSQIMARSLGLIGDIDLNYAAGDSATEKLRRTIYDKNYSFFFQWRPPNMEYLLGRRNRLPGAEGMPEETAQLNDIVGQLDRRIWRMEKPQPGKVWGKYPMDIQLSASTPDYTGIRIPEIGEVVRRGGDEEEGRGDVLTPDEALKRFHLPEGYAINVFASEENSPIANPVAMHFDVEGRLWVANSPTWPHPLPGSKPNDSIIILEDTDHDGVVDKQSVFINGLDMIHGFILGDGGAYISQTPNIIHIKDTNGDGRADTVRTVLHGFGGEDVEHSINNYRWGPDGALYFMEGIFFHTQVETPYGPRRVRDAGVFRYKPLTERFDVFVSYAFWNPWGQVFDRWGQSIVLDASSHDYFNMDILSANFVYPKKKHNEHDKLSFAPDDTGPGAGIEIVSSGHFPDDVQGRFLAGELSGGFRGIRWYEMSDAETSYELKRLNPEFLISDDPFFRPLALSFGPDGALYVADFYSALIENTSQPKRRFGRDHIHGRIYRITYPERKLLMPPKITGQPISELLDLLKIHENATRQLAQRELQGRATEQVIIHLKNWMNKLDSAHPEYERHLLESLWIYQRHEVVEPKLLIRLLDAKDFRVRASATRVLRFWQDRMDHSIELLEKMVEDDHARVRLQAVLACGFNSSDRAVSVALRATRHPMDAGLRNALDDTMDYFDRIKAGK
jgi:putative membrane-bound dehydrogenase-like protein